MKYLGNLMSIVGFILLAIAIKMKTSVAVDYPNGNEFGLPERVNNLGLMADKQNYLIVSSVFIIVGLIFRLLPASKAVFVSS